MSMLLVESQGNIIYEFGRDETGKATIKKQIKKPYFYYSSPKGIFTSLTGEKCSKCICNKPQDVKIIRERYAHTFEDDVTFANRHITDEYYDKKIESTKIKKWYLDIEVDDTQGYDAIRTFDMPITALTVYDNFMKKYYTLVLKRNVNYNHNDKAVKSFDTEKDLLKFFASLMKMMDPDLITAWNISFDLPYIITRMNRLGCDANKLSRINKTLFIGEYMSIKGRVTLDLLEAYKKLTFGQLSSYALEFVAREELGEGKDKYEGKINDMSDAEFISYNVRDVELLVILDEKLHIIDFFDTIRRLAKCNFHDVFSNKRVVDAFILSKAKQKKIVLPGFNKDAKKEKFEGAYVKEPPKGLHDWVSALDFKSLYPSIIMQFNMSFETFIPLQQVPDYPPDRIINIDNKYHFLKDIKGFASEIMEELMDTRTIYKNLMYEARRLGNNLEEHMYDMMQNAIKIIMNSYYGVTTSPYFRLSIPQIGAAITHCGRALIHRAEEFCDEQKKEVVIVDTDSDYIKTGATNMLDAEKISSKLNKEMESIWDPFLDKFNAGPNKKIIMEHEKIYETLLTIGVKKRYSGNIVWKDGYPLTKPKMDTKGMQTVRSDFPIRAQRFLKGMITKILAKKGELECLNYIKDFREDFKLGKVEEIGFPSSIKKKEDYKNRPMHVRAMLNSEKYLNMPYVGGSKIKYYFIKKTPANIPFDNVFVFDGNIPKGFELDWDRAFERVIHNPLENVFDSIGWDFDKVTNPQQSKLADWW